MSRRLSSLIPKKRNSAPNFDDPTKATNEKTEKDLAIKQSGSDGYDPYQHRNKDHTLNNFEAMMALIKGTLGPGIIGLPYAFMISGYAPAIIFLLIYPTIFVYCTHLLVSAMYDLCKEHHVPILSYADAMRLALRSGPSLLQCFSKASVFIVDILLVIYHFTSSILHIVFIASMVQNVIDDYIISLDSRILMVVLILPLIPIFSIKTFKNQIPMWALANFLHCASFVTIFYFVFRNLPSFEHMHVAESPMKFADSLGVFIFSLQSMGTMLPIEAKMQNPKSFLGWFGLVSVSHACISVLYIIFGLFGYWRYGIDVEENMTMNLSERDVGAQLVRVMFATAVCLTYPLHASVVINNVWYHWLSRLVIEKDRNAIEFVVRIIIVLLSAIMAVCLVNMTAIVPFASSLCITTLGIVFPALINICIRYQTGFGKLKWILVKDITLMLLGVCLGIVGTIAAFRMMLHEMRFT